MQKVFAFFGGRKLYAMHLALLVGCVAAYPLGASFVEFAGFVVGALTVGGFSIAYEDRAGRLGGSNA